LAAFNHGRLLDKVFLGDRDPGITCRISWLGIALVIFSRCSTRVPAADGGDGGFPANWDESRHLILPSLLSMIPCG